MSKIHQEGDLINISNLKTEEILEMFDKLGFLDQICIYNEISDRKKLGTLQDNQIYNDIHQKIIDQLNKKMVTLTITDYEIGGKFLRHKSVDHVFQDVRELIKHSSNNIKRLNARVVNQTDLANLGYYDFEIIYTPLDLSSSLMNSKSKINDFISKLNEDTKSNKSRFVYIALINGNNDYELADHAFELCRYNKFGFDIIREKQNDKYFDIFLLVSVNKAINTYFKSVIQSQPIEYFYISDKPNSPDTQRKNKHKQFDTISISEGKSLADIVQEERSRRSSESSTGGFDKDTKKFIPNQDDDSPKSSWREYINKLPYTMKYFLFK